MKGICLRCNKEYEIPWEKYRFCKDCRIIYENQLFVDNGAQVKIRENKDRHIRGVQQ